MEVLGWITWALTISIFSLEWLRYGWFPISLSMPSRTRVVMWHLHVVCELLIHSLLRLLVVWNLFMCSLDYRSMYYNCSILHLASCAGKVCLDLFPWWVHWLFTLFSTSLLLWTWSLFIWSWSKRQKEVLCHNALVTTHVCSVTVFVSHVDMTFSWMVSTPALRLFTHKTPISCANILSECMK
jgi:hypothetical protein